MQRPVASWLHTNPPIVVRVERRGRSPGRESAGNYQLLKMMK
jgi:hypothetical protein